MKQLLIGIGWFLVGALVLFGEPWPAGRAAVTSPTSAVVMPAARPAPVSFLPGKEFPSVSTPPSLPETAPLSSDAAVVASTSAVVTLDAEPSGSTAQGGRHGRFGAGEGSRYRRPGRLAWPTDRLQAVLRAQVVQTP